MNKPEFRAEMARNSDNYETLSDYLRISTSSLCAKVNETGGAQFNQREMLALRIKWNLSDERFVVIFFTKAVS